MVERLGIGRDLDAPAHLGHRRIGDAGVGELGEARLAAHQRRRDGMLQADLAFAAGRDVRAVGALQQQRIAADRDPLDGRLRMGAPPVERAVEQRDGSRSRRGRA